MPPLCLSSPAKLREIEFTQWRSLAAQPAVSNLANRDAEEEPTRRFETLAFEHVAQVAPTSSADDLGAFCSKREVHVAGYGTRDRCS